MKASEKKAAGVYAIVGNDRFLRHEALRELLRSLGESSGGLGPTRIDGGNATLADVLDEVRTPSLLEPCCTVLVDDADDFISANRAALEKYCGNPSDTGRLILLCDSMPKNTRLYKIIAEHTGIISCEAPQGRALISWITQRARQCYGKRIAEPAGQRLREHLGDAPGWIDTELSKLAAYVGNREEITAADVDAVTGELREEKVFAVTDAIAAGDTALALKLWEQVWATDRAAPGRAIAGLAWSVRRLIEARQDYDQGVDVGALARRMFTDPTVLRKRLERMTAADLRRQQKDLLSADLAVKTGLATVDAAIERFIVKHSTAAAAA